MPKSGVMKLQSKLLESYFYEDYMDWEKGINEENSRLIKECVQKSVQRDRT